VHLAPEDLLVIADRGCCVGAASRPTLTKTEASEVVWEDVVRVQSPGVEFVKFVVLIVMSPDALIWL
jgi:hypothetical protein